MESIIAAVGKPQLLVGINYPWGFNKYGWYFGPKHDERWIANNFYGWDVDGKGHYEREAFRGGPRFPSAFSLHLEDLRSRFGIRLIRLFLLCNGQNLGDGTPWRILDPLPPEFCEHLTVILKTLRHHGMKAILSILDFGIGSPMERTQGRHRIVVDPRTRADFVERVVVPFARIGASYHDAILAWEAMNEPGWLNRNTWPHPKTLCTAAATVDEINAYLRAVFAGIRSVDPVAKTTVGHRFHRDMAVFETGDLPQFHFYPTYIREPFGLTPTPLTVPGTDPAPILSSASSYLLLESAPPTMMRSLRGRP